MTLGSFNITNRMVSIFLGPKNQRLSPRSRWILAYGQIQEKIVSLNKETYSGVSTVHPSFTEMGSMTSWDRALKLTTGDTTLKNVSIKNTKCANLALTWQWRSQILLIFILKYFYEYLVHFSGPYSRPIQSFSQFIPNTTMRPSSNKGCRDVVIAQVISCCIVVINTMHLAPCWFCQNPREV